MLTQSQIDDFNRDGYLVLNEQVLDPGRVEQLKDRLDRVMQGRSDREAEAVRNLVGGDLQSENVVVQIVNIWEADDLFRDLVYDENITAMLAQLMNASTVRLWHDQIQYKPPIHGAPTDWHQDHPYWPIIEPADLVSCWIALDDATLENGCMRVVPGSHRWGAAPGGLRSDDAFNPVYSEEAVPPGEKVEVVPCEVRSGSCMFHHCLNWHGSHHNRSDRPRRAIALHYMPGHTRYVPRAGHLVEHRVTVQPGEILKGEFFPTVIEDGRQLRPAGSTVS